MEDIEKTKSEIDWWLNQDLNGICGGDLNVFFAHRKQHYYDRMKHYASYWEKETGKGAEIGTGLTSFFEWDENTQREYYAVDPLLDEYKKMIPGFFECGALNKFKSGRVNYVKSTHENIPIDSNECDFVICANTIDHTWNPIGMIKEIHRILKPNKFFYFEVHMDPQLGGAHYEVWNENKITEIINPIFGNPIFVKIIDGCFPGQKQYHAIYRKE